MGKGTLDKSKAQTQGRIPSRRARSSLGPVHVSSGIAIGYGVSEKVGRKCLRNTRGMKKGFCGPAALSGWENWPG